MGDVNVRFMLIWDSWPSLFWPSPLVGLCSILFSDVVFLNDDALWVNVSLRLLCAGLPRSGDRADGSRSLNMELRVRSAFWRSGGPRTHIRAHCEFCLCHLLQHIIFLMLEVNSTPVQGCSTLSELTFWNLLVIAWGCTASLREAPVNKHMWDLAPKPGRFCGNMHL